MKCPDCGRENPETAMTCDCGYDFSITPQGPLDKVHSDHDTQRRSPIVAGVLSLLVPGLGQAYNRQMGKGIILYFARLVPFFLATITGLIFTFYGFLTALIVTVALPLFIAGDAFLTARRIKRTRRSPYDKWYVYGAVVILSLFVVDPGVWVPFFRDMLGVRTYRIPASSMEPTVQRGDHILANLRLCRTRTPKRGELIIFRLPRDRSKDVLKRVVAIGGDTVEIRDKRLMVNGKVEEEPYAQHIDRAVHPRGLSPRDNIGPLTVPKDHFFVLGDNRDESYDSRFWGFLDRKLLVGRPLLVYWNSNWGKALDRMGRSL
jgi:signal peptidase I